MDRNLAGYVWEDVFRYKDQNDNWEKFKEIYKENIDTYVPSKMVKPGQRLLFPWVRYKSVEKAKANFRKAKVKANISGLHADQYLADEAKQAIDASVLSAKAHYEDKLTHQIKKDPKRFFNYARHFTRSSSSIDVLEHEGSKVTEDGAKAEILNSFFVSVRTDEHPLELYHFTSDSENPKFILRDIHFSVEDVRKKNFKN